MHLLSFCLVLFKLTFSTFDNKHKNCIYVSNTMVFKIKKKNERFILFVQFSFVSFQEKPFMCFSLFMSNLPIRTWMHYFWVLSSLFTYARLSEKYDRTKFEISKYCKSFCKYALIKIIANEIQQWMATHCMKFIEICV